MRRPRPLPELPPPGGEGVVKAWLLELLRDAPLQRAPAIAASPLAAGGDALGSSIVAALGDDGFLDALEAAEGPARALAEVGMALAAGPAVAADPTAGIVRPPPLRPVGRDSAGPRVDVAPGVLDAAEVLRGVLLTALAPAVAADPALAAAAQDRVAHVVGRLARAALAQLGPSGAPAVRPEELVREAPAAPPPVPGSPRRPAPLAAVPAPEDEPEDEDDEEPWPTPPAAAPGGPVRGPGQAPTFAGRVAAGGPIALVRVELLDADRLEQAGEDSALLAAERALRGALPPGASVSGDEPGRWTVLAQAEDGLARRLVGAVRDVPGPHGVPLRAAAGVARLPEDGRTAYELLGSAEARLLAARAAGVELLA